MNTIPNSNQTPITPTPIDSSDTRTRSLYQKEAVRAYAQSLGFERIGITSAEAAESDGDRLESWLSAGFAGEMDYMEKNHARRSRPADLLTGAKSVLVLAMNYFNPDDPDHSEGRIARYAWGRDYHTVIGKRLDGLVRYLQSLAPDVGCKTFVDAGPLLERAFARRAGLGFVGKNTVLITKGLGSWVFLASVITTLDLPPDAPDTRSCGECRICIDACPTDALTASYQLDARRCISYLTIESKGPIPKERRPEMNSWIVGCDICQDVCPHNTRIPMTSIPDFKRDASPLINLKEVLSLRNEDEFKTRFAGSPIRRAGRAGLIRNACIAAASLKRHDLIPILEEVSSSDVNPMVREHAAWAIDQLT